MANGGVEARLERGLRLDARELRAPEPANGRRVFTSVYYDTGRRRLARAGLELCRRTEHGKSLWRLTLPRPDGRLVLEEPGGPVGPPEGLRALLIAPLRGGAAVEPVLELRTRRAGSWLERVDGADAEISLDEVDVLDHGRMAGSYREVGVTLVEGESRALRRFERKLRRDGASDAVSPLAVAGDELGDESAVGLLRGMVRRQYEQIVAHDPGVRLGGEPEDLHDIRVAVRRLRAVLRTARPFVDEAWSEPLRAELRWLGTSLGAARDVDVLIGQIERDAAGLDAEARAAAADVVATLEPERQLARRTGLDALASPRYLALLDELERAADGPRVRQSAVDVKSLAGREFEKLRKSARRADGATDDELHRLRIRGKRARYAVELAAPVLGKRGARFLETAKAFQDVVGEHQDAVVAESRLRALLPTTASPEAAFALGRLVERQRARRARMRDVLPEAWRKLERAGRRAF